VAPENQVLKDGLAASKKAKNPPPKPEKKATAGAGQGSASSAGAGAGAAASANGTAETSSAAGPAEKSQADMDLEALFSFAEEVEQQQYVKKKEVSAQPEVDFGTTEQQIGKTAGGGREGERCVTWCVVLVPLTQRGCCNPTTSSLT